MKERPIIFSGEMVRAILDGRKTQTRRVIKGGFPNAGAFGGLPPYRPGETSIFGDEIWQGPICPYGAVGDRLCPVHDGITGDKETNNHNGSTNKRRDSIETNSGFPERRLHGGRGRPYLLTDEVQRVRQEGTYGLVSTERPPNRQIGLPSSQSLSREQKGDEIGSSNGVYGISRDARTAVTPDSTHGREQSEQRAVESSLGDARTELGGSSNSRHGVRGGEASNVETDRRGEETYSLGDLKGAVQPATRGKGFGYVPCSDSVNCTCSDRLWVKETWGVVNSLDGVKPSDLPRDIPIIYRATSAPPDSPSMKWRSPLFMPRWASRITLEITEIRDQRVHDISEEDAQAEGVSLGSVGDLTTIPESWIKGGWMPSMTATSFQAGFGVKWQEINGKKHPWESNPWVWAISFKRIENDEQNEI